MRALAAVAGAIEPHTIAEFLCGFSGGRATYTTTPTGPDSGFNPNPLGNAPTDLTLNPTAQRWFFNPNTGTCTTFQYLYGGGNFNNFRTQNDCENFCYQGAQACFITIPYMYTATLLQSCARTATR